MHTLTVWIALGPFNIRTVWIASDDERDSSQYMLRQAATIQLLPKPPKQLENIKNIYCYFCQCMSLVGLHMD